MASTYSLDLMFDESPSGNRAHVYVKTHTEDERGFIYISPECVSEHELEYQINRLIKELEFIRAKAKKRFSKKKPSR